MVWSCAALSRYVSSEVSLFCKTRSKSLRWEVLIAGDRFNGIRADVGNFLEAMGPSFLRFPGGNNL